MFRSRLQRVFTVKYLYSSNQSNCFCHLKNTFFYFVGCLKSESFHWATYNSEMDYEKNAKISKVDTGTNGGTMFTKIGTHDGTFHCDEVLACSLIKMLPEFENADIIRSRNKQVLEGCDIVLDVGGVFNPETRRFDHHQRNFNETMNTLCPNYPWTTKLSSAGLAYFHYGLRIISNLIGSEVDSQLTRAVFSKVYENFIQEIDAIDNGIDVSDEKPRYLITTNLSRRVSWLNPNWNEENIDIRNRFDEAMEVVKTEFLYKINFYHKHWWPARKLVLSAIENRFKVHESGAIIQLTHGGLPWKDHLFALEEELNLDKSSIKFVLYEDLDGLWRVQCVPVAAGSFISRLPLAEKWRGLRDTELSKVASIEDCNFVHITGFTGGNKTYSGAIEMAIQTMNAG